MIGLGSATSRAFGDGPAPAATEPEFAEQSEMHVQDVALVEPVEEMLSERRCR